MFGINPELFSADNLKSMKSKRNCLQIMVLMLSIFAALALITGCNSDSPVNPILHDDYRVQGIMVMDRNSDSVVVAVAFERNDTTYGGGTVKFGTTTLSFNDSLFSVDSVFSYHDDSSAIFAGEQFALRLEDDGWLVDTFIVSAVDTFSLTDVFDPVNHILPGAAQLSFEWTTAPGAEVYVVAAVPSEQAYTGAGYSAFVTLIGTAGTIPPDAFLIPGTSEPDTGLFNVYAYAVNGAPDNALASEVLPVPLPGQLDDNLSGRNADGRFGTVSVTLLDTVRVVVE